MTKSMCCPFSHHLNTRGRESTWLQELEMLRNVSPAWTRGAGRHRRGRSTYLLDRATSNAAGELGRPSASPDPCPPLLYSDNTAPLFPGSDPTAIACCPSRSPLRPAALLPGGSLLGAQPSSQSQSPGRGRGAGIGTSPPEQTPCLTPNPKAKPPLHLCVPCVVRRATVTGKGGGAFSPQRSDPTCLFYKGQEDSEDSRGRRGPAFFPKTKPRVKFIPNI